MSSAATTRPNSRAEPLVEAKGLTKKFPLARDFFGRPTRWRVAVDDVSLSINRGQTVGLVGESGSGKSTLGRLILRLLPASAGTVRFDQVDVTHAGPAELRRYRQRAQIVFQDPYGSLSPRLSVADIVKEGLNVHHPQLSGRECDERVVAALNDVGLDPQTRFRFPHEFSGGQRQRIAIARAVVLEPTFIVLDEPTSALDMLIQSQMVDLLRDLQKRHELTYLFISHDLRVVAALASRLLVMRHGKVVESGAAAELFKNPKDEYTRALFAAAFELETAPAEVVGQ
jgi:microcin C transport system ATP-binding protein